MNKAIFLDRDGVINSNRDNYYTWQAADVELNPGVPETLIVMKKMGYMLIVISNQGGVSRGEYTVEDVEHTHKAIRNMLAASGAALDEFYFCPHHSDREACLCRKPLPLMVEKAISRFCIDPASSWFIGDSQRDVDAGKAAGLRTLLVEPNGDLRQVLAIIKE